MATPDEEWAELNSAKFWLSDEDYHDYLVQHGMEADR